MPIDDSVLGGRAPRIGSITLGRTRIKDGKLIPTRTKTAVFHTNDGKIANAVLEKFGGEVFNDSDTYEFDVLIEATSFEAWVLPGGFRQDLELWRAAECLRRCDGIRMSTIDGKRPETPTACLCAQEEERKCKPSTILPVLLDLDIDAYAPWMLNSNGWGTASRVKGNIDSMIAAGLDGIVPVTVRCIETPVRDSDGKVQNQMAFDMTIRVALRDLPSIGGGGSGSPAAVRGQAAGALPGGDRDEIKQGLLADWKRMYRSASSELQEQLRADFENTYGGTKTEDLTVEQLQGWLEFVQQMLEAQQANG